MATSSKATLIQQAKQGNAEAVTALLNQTLHPKGITAKASIKNFCLNIMLEAAQPPAQKALVAFLRKSFENFTVDAWHTVVVYGRQTGEEIPDWSEKFDVVQKVQLSLEERAKQRDLESIQTLINQILEAMAISAMASFKDDCLLLMLEAENTPEQSMISEFLREAVQSLEIQDLRYLKLYGRKSGDAFPDWDALVDLTDITPDVAPNHDDVREADQEEEPNQSLAPSQPLCGVELSNQLYEAFQTTCYSSLAYRVGQEEEKTIHSMVRDFIDDLDDDLHRDIDVLAEEVIQIFITYDVDINASTIRDLISRTVRSQFRIVTHATRDLERVTRDVLNTDFPNETDELKAFFSGAAREFTAQMFGATTMSKEAMIGATIGTVFAPGLGSILGGAIGGWIGGQNQQQALQELLERYDTSRTQLFQAWEKLLGLIYDNLAHHLEQGTSVRLMSYQTLDQANTLYEKGNECLSDSETLVQAVEYYSQAVQVNPGFIEAWNNQGYAYNQLEAYEEALQPLSQALEINPEFVPAINNYGDALRNLGLSKEALDAYGESIKLEAQNPSAWLGMGICLYDLEDYQEAMIASEQLINLDPENFLSWYLKSGCHMKIEQHEQAITSLSKAFEINPDAVHQFVPDNPDFDPVREHPQFQILMESRLGIDYASLKKHLKTKQWQKADQETAILMRKLMQKMTDSVEMNPDFLVCLPPIDLKTIDSLWNQMSDGRFGFSVQKQIFEKVSSDRDRFGAETGWRVQDKDGLWTWRDNSSFDYNFSTAPIGHLPSSLWAGEDSWFQNRRDRLIALFQVLNA
jgi:tetratricopeptide (TPR) repeat protein